MSAYKSNWSMVGLWRPECSGMASGLSLYLCDHPQPNSLFISALSWEFEVLGIGLMLFTSHEIVDLTYAHTKWVTLECSTILTLTIMVYCGMLHKCNNSLPDHYISGCKEIIRLQWGRGRYLP